MKRRNSLLENLNSRVDSNITLRRYNLSDIISESYKALYECDKGSNLQKIVEAHLDDVRSNPVDVDRLSHQLCKVKELIRMVESEELNDKELLVPKEKHTPVEPKEEDLKESQHDEDVEEKDDENVLDESAHDEEVEQTEDEDLLEDTELTDEEVEELTKHLSEIRKNKKVAECDAPKREVKESIKARKLKRSNESTEMRKANESKSYENLNLSEFNKKSSSKAFVKTFKKLDSKLHEGTALTRQESISLYKAANSAMTHLSVELEHNPEFLNTFKESVSLLSVDVNKVLMSLTEGKAPSKATMKSLAKFSEALLREDEEEEDLPPIEDEEASMVSEESEEFDQEYADARVELHKELAEEHAESEDPEVQEKLAQDADEVVSLPGITDEQIAEIVGEEDAPEEEEIPEEEEEVEESVHDEDVEEVDEEKEKEEDLVLDTDNKITDDELAELKRYLKEMRKVNKSK